MEPSCWWPAVQRRGKDKWWPYSLQGSGSTHRSRHRSPIILSLASLKGKSFLTQLQCCLPMRSPKATAMEGCGNPPTLATKMHPLLATCMVTSRSTRCINQSLLRAGVGGFLFHTTVPQTGLKVPFPSSALRPFRSIHWSRFTFLLVLGDAKAWELSVSRKSASWSLVSSFNFFLACHETQ